MIEMAGSVRRREDTLAATEEAQDLGPRSELRILRRAVAAGLLSWDDLEAVADQVSHRSTDQRAATGSWLRALVEHGHLSPEAVTALAREASRELVAHLPTPAQPAPDSPPTIDLRQPSRPMAGRGDPGLDTTLAGWERYHLVSFLGAGGMGAVYKAFDPVLMRFVALKFLHRNDPAETARFVREARAQARIDHPHVAQVYEVGEIPDGRPYIAMQLIAGESLSDALAGVPLETQVRVFQQVAMAVHAAHRNGLIHRDLKPGNILVARRQTGSLHPYVLDFGLAQDVEDPTIAVSRSLTGTPAYLAPEQLRGGLLDRRTDVYALGVVLYEVLAGRPPLHGATVAETLTKILDEQPQPLPTAIPKDLAVIVAKCLEKEAGERYDSARALAEDLVRFLDGEPILAHRPSRIYRFEKRLRKHRLPIALGTVALIAFTSLGVASLRAQWQGRERARLAQDFGQRVRQIEADLRLSALLPLHDTSAENRALRATMTALEADMVRLGPLADGPGHYALGRASLALRDNEEAARRLQAAWRAGERHAEVASTLAVALGRLYSRSLLESDRGVSSEARNTIAREISALYREPALAVLKEGGGAQPAPYVAALLAYFEGRWADARGAARQALATTPTLFEARELEAETYLAEGDDALESGRLSEARLLYDQAGESHRALLDVARSDPGAYTAECGRQLRLMQLAAHAETLHQDAVDQALASCDRALQVAPGFAEAHAKKAGILWRWADYQSRRGNDPRRDLEAAAEQARAAIRSDPRDANAYGHLAVAYRLLGNWQMDNGEDERPALDAAIAAAQQMVQLAAGTSAGYNGLGSALLMRATAAERRGLDPRGELDQADEAYQRSIELNPKNPSALANLGNVWKLRAEFEMSHGLDPSVSIVRAIAPLERAKELNPTSPRPRNNLGNAYLTLGEYRLGAGARLVGAGESAQSALEEAAACYRQAVELQAGYYYGWLNLASAERMLADAFDRAGVPAANAALERATAALTQAEQIHPRDADAFLEKAQIALLEARRSGPRGGRALQRAQRALDAALAINPNLGRRAEEVTRALAAAGSGAR